jgi:hypothetical protein
VALKAAENAARPSAVDRSADTVSETAGGGFWFGKRRSRQTLATGETGAHLETVQ